jgi:hypothetical protein
MTFVETMLRVEISHLMIIQYATNTYIIVVLLFSRRAVGRFGEKQDHTAENNACNHLTLDRIRRFICFVLLLCLLHLCCVSGTVNLPMPSLSVVALLASWTCGRRAWRVGKSLAVVLFSINAWNSPSRQHVNTRASCMASPAPSPSISL